ncbi:MAG TPA: hypothetical protein VNW95_07575 [Mucilaginibacter sp.]|jgi:hypothetical protein|nr:hypothetical protein [Mucilaginibacter sp.]
MEVHHHPQLKHSAKPWKEYVLEGLMIFLAVMMGFFAESFREHLSDRAKETEFMRSMIEDLKADTTAMNLELKTYPDEFKKIDTMLTALKSDKPDGDLISRFVAEDFWMYGGYSYNNRTIQQLRNAGNFRLIRNQEVADRIIKYDNNQTVFMLNQYRDLQATMMAYKDVEARAIRYKELKNSKNSDYLLYFDPSDFDHTGKHAYITPDKELIALYYNRLFTHEVLGQTFLKNMKHTRAKAIALIAFIKKEYGLD